MIIVGKYEGLKRLKIIQRGICDMLACFVTNICPRSIQAQGVQKYKKNLIEEFNNQRVSFKGTPFSSALYSKIIYIHLAKTDIDVDNLSKPLVDAFKGILYDDDIIINHRVCSKISYNDFIAYEINIESLPSEIIERFDGYLEEKSEHILYFEIGNFSESMVYIGGEKDETW